MLICPKGYKFVGKTQKNHFYSMLKYTLVFCLLVTLTFVQIVAEKDTTSTMIEEPLSAKAFAPKVSFYRQTTCQNIGMDFYIGCHLRGVQVRFGGYEGRSLGVASNSTHIIISVYSSSNCEGSFSGRYVHASCWRMQNPETLILILEPPITTLLEHN
jgi:hypothetical protein